LPVGVQHPHSHGLTVIVHGPIRMLQYNQSSYLVSTYQAVCL
jgi:hypothetical protein